MIGKGSLEGGKISFRILSEEEQKKEEETQRVLQQCIEAMDDSDYVTAIELMEKAVNLGYRGDYSLIYKIYLSGYGNVPVNYSKGAMWLERFYNDYKNDELTSKISAELMVEVCYNLGVLYAEEIKHKNVDRDTQYIVDKFREAVNFGANITCDIENIDNTAKFLFTIGGCFYYGTLSTNEPGVEIEKDLEYAYKSLSLAEHFGNKTSIFLIAQMYEKGLYVEENKETAGKLYLKAAYYGEEHAIAWCQENYIDKLPWRKLSIWDNLKLPRESVKYIEDTSLYRVETFSEFKCLRMQNIIEVYIDNLSLYNYFSIIRNYMKNIVIYMEINNMKGNKSLFRKSDFELDNNEYKKICYEITRENPCMLTFFDNIENMSFFQESNSKTINCDIKKLLKVMICFVYRFAKIYDLELEDIISDGYCGLIEAIYKYSSEKNTNYIVLVMRYVLNHIIKNNYNQQLVKFKNSHFENWYYLIYPLIKKEIFDLEGPQKKEYIDQIIEEQCKISDMRKFMFETKIFELYEKMDHLYQYEGFFYASRMIESYEENCDKSDYESWLGIYEENYDLIGDKVDVMKIINTFNTRQQTIIKFYYGVESHSKTIEELSNDYKISRQRVQQIVKNGLEKIKVAYEKGSYYKREQEDQVPYRPNYQIEKIIQSKYKHKHLNKKEISKIYSIIENFYHNNINLNYIKKNDLEIFIIAYYQRYDMDINHLLKKICQVLNNMSNEIWLEKKKKKVYSFRQAFIITRACMVYDNEDMKELISIIEISLGNIRKLHVEQKALSRTIRYVDKFLEKQFDVRKIKNSASLRNQITDELQY